MINKIWFVILMCFAIIFFLVVPQKTVLAVDSVSLLLVPSSRTIRVNDMLDVDIKFNASRNSVLGLSFEVNFDKTKLNLLEPAFNSRSNTGFTAFRLVPSNTNGFFQYFAIGDPANVAAGDVTLGTLHFKAIAPTDAGATADVTFPVDKIIAGSADNPLLQIDPNQNNLKGAFTITSIPGQVSTDQFRWAFDRSAFTDALPWQDYTEESKIQNIIFPADMPAGQKQIWVEFQDSTGKISRHNAPIKLLGSEPAITGCSLNFEGTNVIFDIRGTNLGSRGTGKSNETNLQVREWSNTSAKLTFPNAPVGQSFPISLTNGDGQIADGLCAGSSSVSLGAKVFCRAPAQHDTDAVEMILAGGFEGGKKAKETVRIDRNGAIQNLTQKLEEGKKYKISLKAPKSLRKVAEFTASSGTTNIPNFTLPVGDIFPVDGGDVKINNFDKSELNRQWISGQSSAGRSGDFNLDGRVNSIDWACMRQDFGKNDDEEPAPGGPAASPSSSPVATSSASPSPGT